MVQQSAKFIAPAAAPKASAGAAQTAPEPQGEDAFDAADAAADIDAADAADATDNAELRSLAVPVSLHGQRLDRALAALVPEFSRSYLSQLIESGAVHGSPAAGPTAGTAEGAGRMGSGPSQAHGQPLRKPAHKVRAGDVLHITLRPTPISQAFVPQPIALDVVHEDEHLLILHKPAGMVVHPAPGNWSGTLLNALLARDGRAAQLPRAGIVHRLDKDTSGLMAVARSRAAMDALVAAIAARQVRREYLALAHRPWGSAPLREVDAPIGRDPRQRLRMAVVDLARHPGKPAQTLFELLAQNEQGCLLRCLLRTGRTHQIRVHLAHLGHPLLADALYGGAPAAGMARQALHARRLALAHPITGQPLDFAAPLPADMAAALAAWGMPAQA